MGMVEVDGLSIAYERAGSGPPLVLVHGFVGDGESTWSGQLDGLSDEFTVVAWDAPGAGRSASVGIRALKQPRSPAPDQKPIPPFGVTPGASLRASTS